MYIDSGADRVIHGVVTQGRAQLHDTQWVTGYKVHVYRNGWVQVLNEAGSWYFSGNNNQNTQVRHRFRYPVTTRYVKFTPLYWSTHMSMRAGLLT